MSNCYDHLLSLLDFLVSELMAARLLSVREQYPAENGAPEEEDVRNYLPLNLSFDLHTASGDWRERCAHFCALIHVNTVSLSTTFT